MISLATMVEDGNRRDEKGLGRLERPVRTKIHVKKFRLWNAEATGFLYIGLDRSTGTRYAFIIDKPSSTSYHTRN